MDFKLGTSMNVVLLSIVTTFMSLVCFLPPENIRKPLLPAEAYQNPAKDLTYGF